VHTAGAEGVSPGFESELQEVMEGTLMLTSWNDDLSKGVGVRRRSA
jgi:hypothetical protein